MIIIEIEHIEKYLEDVKNSVSNGEYRIELNSRRQKNKDLFDEYILNEASAKQILLDLKATDFSEAVANEHIGFEHEILYIFGKSVNLAKRFE